MDAPPKKEEVVLASEEKKETTDNVTKKNSSFIKTPSRKARNTNNIHNCEKCKSTFYLWSRKLECPVCHQVMCSSCCSNEITLPPEYAIKTKATCCQNCFEKILLGRNKKHTETVRDSFGEPAVKTQVLQALGTLANAIVGANHGDKLDRSMLETMQAKSPAIVKNGTKAKDFAIEVKGETGQVKLPIRVFTPVVTTNYNIRNSIQEPDIKRPVIIWYHGVAGWVLGSLYATTTELFLRDLARKSGCHVVGVEYRLAPENKFPAGVEDCYLTYKWVLENANTFGGDASMIAIGGDSAGGTNAAAVCIMSKKNGIALPKYLILAYPMANVHITLENKLVPAEEKQELVWLINQYLSKKEDLQNILVCPGLSPELNYFPPTFVITAGYDHVKPEVTNFVEKLTKAGVDVTHTVYANSTHGFLAQRDEYNEAVAQIALYVKAEFKSDQIEQKINEATKAAITNLRTSLIMNKSTILPNAPASTSSTSTSTNQNGTKKEETEIKETKETKETTDQQPKEEEKKI